MTATGVEHPKGEERGLALRLVPLPGSPDPGSIDGSWAGFLPAAVAVADPADLDGDAEAGGRPLAATMADRLEPFSALPLVLLGSGQDAALAAELTSELERRKRPAPLALLIYGPPAAPAAARVAPAAIELGPGEDLAELAEPLMRELSRLVDLGREVRSFVDSDLLDGEAGEVTDTTPLLELGIVDSVSIVAVIAFVEEELGIPVPEEEIHPRHLADVLSIQRLIVSLRAARRHGPEG